MPALPAAVASEAAPTLAAPTLAALGGRKRVLVAFAPRADDPRLAEQARAAAALTAAADDRDLVFVRVVGGKAEGLADPAAVLRARLGAGTDAFRVVLVGKDGRVAASSAAPLSAAELGARIDAMPMRREEMRRR